MKIVWWIRGKLYTYRNENFIQNIKWLIVVILIDVKAWYIEFKSEELWRLKLLRILIWEIGNISHLDVQ